MSQQSKALNILLAEDDEDDVRFVTDALHNLEDSVQLSTVSDGKALMDALHEKPHTHYPDLILLDINMPLKNGMEVLEELKEDERLCRIPVTILSTSHSRKVINEAYERGANCYVMKPNDDYKWNVTMNGVVKFWKEIAELPD